MAAIPDLDSPLSDGVVALRLPAEWDIPDILIAHEDDPQLFLALGVDRPPSGAELGRQVEEAPGQRAAGVRLTLTVTHDGHNDCRGRLDIHNINWAHARAEVGLWIAPGLRGRGLGARVLRLAAPWVFERCGLERLGLLTETDNAAMLGAARAAGFRDEGILRSYGREHGRRIDLALLSLLPADL